MPRVVLIDCKRSWDYETGEKRPVRMNLRSYAYYRGHKPTWISDRIRRNVVVWIKGTKLINRKHADAALGVPQKPSANFKLWSPDADYFTDAFKYLVEEGVAKVVRADPADEDAAGLLELDGVPGIATSKQKKEFYAAEKARIDFEAAAGNLVSVVGIEKEAMEVALMVRDRLLQIPIRLSAELTPEQQELVRVEIEDVLTLMADRMERKRERDAAAA